MKSFNKYLQQFPHYKPEVYESALPYLSVKIISAKDHFLREGNVCRNIAFVKKGLLRLYYLNDGKEITKCFCKENTITTSYSSLITQKDSEIAIQAIEDTELIMLSYDSLQKPYARNMFWQQLGRMVAGSELITTECHHRFLRDLSATERYKEMLTNEGKLLDRIPLNYLASYLQISPETLSRIRKKLKTT